ncbi:hypothetical protein GCM10010885_04120 [Alicyclobacillus cellulosilyticus]|uniref:YwhD-like protein n=1 Tax=Alicyclobacillus cellulosilyticus TaxID=1003997 RepID=A0A917K1H1_9BACL|nr:YwhD family protein [Alicyclobacillus cellulosilyticus]GGI97612.1 hypothetical protein GCM10010885_04120 [Alicyclobacillus cellulosilyticus]
MEKLGLTGASKHTGDDALRGLSAVLVDGDEVFVDNGAIHAKSRVERGIAFVDDRALVPQPRHIIGFWITLHRFEGGTQGFYGAMPFHLWIDSEAKKGYKSLAEQVKGMEKAIRGTVDVSSVPADVRHRVAAFLQQIRPDLWEHAAPGFREAFLADGAVREDQTR